MCAQTAVSCLCHTGSSVFSTFVYKKNKKQKKSLPFPHPCSNAHHSTPLENMLKLNSFRADGNHMHLVHTVYTDTHTFNKNSRDGTRGELHRHLIRGAKDFRLRDIRQDGLSHGAPRWGWEHWWGNWCRRHRGSLMWAL